jgi:hypothetical protein
MQPAMPIWIIIAILGTIGITLLLAGLLYRLNAPPQRVPRERQGGDNASPVLFAGGGGRTSRDDSPDGDGGGADGGGGDGGGGGE